MNEKIKNALAKGKRKWIPAIGWFLFLGFFNNCVIFPFFDIKVVEWGELLTALGVMLSISGARDVGLKKESPESSQELVIDGKVAKVATIGKRYWIPAIGWCLAFAFLNNCAIYPYADVKVVEWVNVLTGLGVLLGISGTRDIFLSRNRKIAEQAAIAAAAAADAPAETTSAKGKKKGSKNSE